VRALQPHMGRFPGKTCLQNGELPTVKWDVRLIQLITLCYTKFQIITATRSNVIYGHADKTKLRQTITAIVKVTHNQQ